MQFNFGMMASGGNQGMSTIQSAEETQTKRNWFNALVRVTVVDLAIRTALVPPTLAFAAALSEDPVPQQDGSWLWVYHWNNPEGHDCEIRLLGRIDGHDVDWELSVKDLEAMLESEPVVWFYGQTNIVNDSGYWVFNHVEDGNEEEFIRIDWSVEANDQRSLVFANIREGHEEFGDELSYTVDGTIFTMNFYDASENLNADITWDEVTGAGSIQVPDYNDGERACWDEDQDDIECPDTTS